MVEAIMTATFFTIMLVLILAIRKGVHFLLEKEK